MTPEEESPDINRQRDLFDRAMELPAAEREAFVRREAGGDASLQSAVLQLLDHAGERTARLAQAPGMDATRKAELKQIGPYRLLDELGEGGMGTVYLAEQREPVHRRVALKLIKLGMDSKAVVARFEQERQALALMDHQGIAKVFDCGTTERGQPFFVMELVKGVPLDIYCEQQRLSLSQRLELMQQVCAAVQHAHHKGVIHRDLKPGNVLVCDVDGELQVKIIDFGLAKAMYTKLVQESLFTEMGVVLGTPEYMAPEQADPSNLDVDTRADVYSLGVMMYQLLVGELPFSGEKLREAGVMEMQRVLREVDPPRPSTKLMTSGARSAAVAKQLRVSASTLRRALKCDLDWVVVKALEKDRNRRYESAAALGQDLHRFLRHEPLVAGPPSAAYRLQKLVMRHRATVTAAALVLVAVIGGGVATFVQWQRAEGEAKQNRLLAEAQRAAVVQLSRQASDLSESVRRFEDLSSVVEYSELTSEEAVDSLYPEWPGQVAAMESWMGDARRLLGRKGDLLATVAALREQAAPLSPVEVAELKRRRARKMKLEVGYTTAELAHWIREQPASRDGSLIFNVEGVDVPSDLPVDELTKAINDAMSWDDEGEDVGMRRFADTAEGRSAQMLYETLVKRLAKFPDLQEKLDQVQRQKEWAQQVDSFTFKHPNRGADWADVRRSIAASDTYAGCEIPLDDSSIRRQWMGLIPIGENPVTKMWEFYDLRTAWDGVAEPAQIDVPEHDADGGIELGTTAGVVFVLLPGGSVQLGSQSDDVDEANYDSKAHDDEGVHQVVLAPFLLARHELTQGQWFRMMAWNESLREPSVICSEDVRAANGYFLSSSHPVENVDWRTSHTLLAHYGMVLPTEAQWEYACRGGTESPWGVPVYRLRRIANIADLSSVSLESVARDGEMWNDGHANHAPVGSFHMNAFGLFDMQGNVSEWCLDPYGGYGTEQRGSGARGFSLSTERSVRGGNFLSLAAEAKAATRQVFPSVWKSEVVGLRPARLIAR